MGLGNAIPIIDKDMRDVLALDPNPALYSPAEHAHHAEEYQKFIRVLVLSLLRESGIPNQFYGLTREEFSPATIGSDGRFEKPKLHKLVKNGTVTTEDVQRHVSPLQLLVITQRKLSGEITKATREILSPLFEFFQVTIANPVEFHSLEDDDICMIPDRNGKRHHWPCRTLDSSALDQTDQVANSKMVALRQKLTLTIQQEAGPIMKELSGRTRIHRDITETGSQRITDRTVRHFDRTSGELYFRKGSIDKVDDVASVKHGPLRLIQTYITRELCKLVLRQESEGIIETLPTPTASKLEHLGDSLHLDRHKIEALEEAYRYFLWLYNTSQFEATRGNSVVRTNPQELNEQIATVIRILKLIKNKAGSSAPFNALKT